jgi:thiamine biosynthesis lipoprotein
MHRILGVIWLLYQMPCITAQPVKHWQRYEFSHPQMGTVFRLVFFARADTASAAAWAKSAFNAVDSLNASMSDYLPESELSRLSAHGGTGKPVAVSPDLWDILKRSEKFSYMSGGAFDVTVGPLTRLWRRARNLKELPDTALVQKAKIPVDYRLLIVDPNFKVRLNMPGMRLDLGGIAQGYAADRCLKILRDYGVTRAMADAGGDIALGDPPPGKKGWEIETPAIPGKVMILSRCGITTSGASYRYLEAGGKRYSHIVDPRTGWGLTHRVLVTVQARDATTADAWATAISVLGKTGWENIRRKPRKMQVWLTEEKW